MPARTIADPWDARFGFFWYNDREIRASQAELDRQAEELAAAGINQVITFSCTHFRWSFRRHWEELTQVLGRVVEACHRSGIGVTEHHSSHLTFNPLDDEGVRYTERVLTVRGSSLASWPQLLEDAAADPLIDGTPLSKFRQIDGRTGEWARSSYQGWCLCFNNPDYRRAYLAYLETLYAVGIDGIMTDDVQWFGDGHACACAHCRRLFAAASGHELPEPGTAWDRWHGDYDEPSYLAWLDFRLRSIEEFHRAVTDHYQGLGLRLIRPNYVSSALNRNPTAYSLETLPQLDWVFQECCFSTIIRYSWPHWAVEAAHRYAVGRRRGIPSMSMFYPDRWDTMLFTWSLAMSWGGLYLATPEGKSLSAEEGVLRAFERQHQGLLRGQQRTVRLAFYDSRRNRELYGHAEARSLHSMKAWMQASYLGNLPFDLFQREELGRLGEYEVVVLNEVAVLSEEELVAFRDFVLSGRALVWTGATGTRSESGTRRTREFVSRSWGLDSVAGTGDGEEVEVHPLGEGRLVLAPGDLGLGPYLPAVNADRWQADPVRVSHRNTAIVDSQPRRDVRGMLLGLLPGGPDLTIQNMPPGVMATVFRTADGDSLLIHLVNAAGALTVAETGDAGHADAIPFPAHGGMVPATLRVRKPRGQEQRLPRMARYLDPERDDEVRVPMINDGDAVKVQVRGPLIRAYGLVEIALE
jgi:hypothetical protein